MKYASSTILRINIESEINGSYHLTEKPDKMQALPQVLAVMANDLLLLAFGLTLGYPTILIPGVTKKGETFEFDEEGISWIGSINLICIPIGCIISGTLSEYLGRKITLIIINIPFVAAWLLFYYSYKTWHIYLALALTGLTGGSLEAPILTYIAEVTQPKFRGILASTSALTCIFGISVMFIFGMFLDWRTIALIACGFHAASFVSLFFIPETPFWLIKKRRFEEAKKSLAWLRGSTENQEIEEEYAAIYKDVRKNQDIEKRKWYTEVKYYTKANFLWPFALIIFMHFLSHYGGFSSLQAYAVLIFKTLQTPISDLQATGILGIAELIGSAVNAILIYWWGKRGLTFTSLIGTGVIYIIVGTYAYTWDITTLLIPNLNVTEQSSRIEIPNDNIWAPLVLLVFYTFFAFIGIKIIPWVILAEMFNSDTRSTGTGICSAISYIISFICNKTYFQTVNEITLAGSFWIYASISIVGCTILYYTLPETEGKSLFEICEHFDGGRKLDNMIKKISKKRNSMKMQGINNTGYASGVPDNLNSRQMSEVTNFHIEAEVKSRIEVTKL